MKWTLAFILFFSTVALAKDQLVPVTVHVVEYHSKERTRFVEGTSHTRTHEEAWVTITNSGTKVVYTGQALLSCDLILRWDRCGDLDEGRDFQGVWKVEKGKAGTITLLVNHTFEKPVKAEWKVIDYRN